MSQRLDQHRFDDIFWWRLKADSPLQRSIKDFTREFIFGAPKIDQTLRLVMEEELETVWCELMADKDRNLALKPVFLEFWRRVESRLEKSNGRRTKAIDTLTKNFQKFAALYRQLMFE